MQRKAKVDEKAQHTDVCEHFEITINAVMRPSLRPRTKYGAGFEDKQKSCAS
jgi:hypothetical protein